MLKCLGDGLGDHGETSKKCPAGEEGGEASLSFWSHDKRETFIARGAREVARVSRHTKTNPRLDPQEERIYALLLLQMRCR